MAVLLAKLVRMARTSRPARETGAIERAVLAADYDEFGIEQAVYDGSEGELVRVHHAFVDPEEVEEREEEARFVAAPVRAGIGTRPDGTADGPDAVAAVARLYQVEDEAMAGAAEELANADEHMGEIFTPFEAWWNALGIPYPGPPEFDTPDVEVNGS